MQFQKALANVSCDCFSLAGLCSSSAVNSVRRDRIALGRACRLSVATTVSMFPAIPLPNCLFQLLRSMESLAEQRCY